MSKSRSQRNARSHRQRSAQPASAAATGNQPKRKFSTGWMVASVVLATALGAASWHLFVAPTHEARPSAASDSIAAFPPATPPPATPLSNQLATASNGVVSLAGEPPGPGKDTKAIQLNQEANKLLNAGDLPGAIGLYEKALTLTPDDEDLHYNLGIAYARAGENAKAEREYRAALKLLPDYAEVHNNLGNLLLRMGRLEEAEQEFNQAINAMPEYAAAHNNLGIVRQRQKRLPDALACFQKAVEYDTNYFEAHFNLASSYLLDHQKDKALLELREALRINPNFAPAQHALATLTGQVAKPGP